MELKKMGGWAWWDIPVMLVVLKAEAGGWLVQPQRGQFRDLVNPVSKFLRKVGTSAKVLSSTAKKEKERKKCKKP